MNSFDAFNVGNGVPVVTVPVPPWHVVHERRRVVWPIEKLEDVLRYRVQQSRRALVRAVQTSIEDIGLPRTDAVLHEMGVTADEYARAVRSVHL